MYRVCKGQKIKNVKDGESIRNYYGGEKLPKDYKPPKSYIENKIVEKIKGGK
jgi:hypothetical protein